MAQKTSERKQCLKCLKSKVAHTQFYKSNSDNHSDGRYPICRDCIKDKLNLENPLSNEAINSVKNTLIEMNRPFIYTQYLSSIDEAERRGKELFGIYIKNINLNYKDCSWKDSEFESANDESDEIEEEDVLVEKENTNSVTVSNDYAKELEEVVRILGYDPFEFESDRDKLQLYNRLIDFLDESTQEDGFKLQAVIEIVIGFNQIDKINQAITNITNDPDKLSTNSGGISSLITSKKNILASLIKLAEENGISVKHNNQKSKGAGTLTGIMKALQEKGIEEGELNLFDIETAKGIRQVADLSNKSIVAQLQFDENDYTNMLLEQREMIQELDSKVMSLEEENRLLKKELMKYKHIEIDND